MSNSSISSAFGFSGYSCEFVTGDGVSDSEIYMGYKPNGQTYIDASVNKKMTDPEINGATTTPCGRGDCFREKNRFDSDKNPSWKSCRLYMENNSKCKIQVFFSYGHYAETIFEELPKIERVKCRNYERANKF